MIFSKKRLRIALDLRRLSNSSFAELLGCSLSKVKQLVNDGKEISVKDMERICYALNLPISFFENDELEAVEEDEIFYRSVARIKAGYKGQNRSNTVLVKEINQYFTKQMNLPEFNLNELNLDDTLYKINNKSYLDDRNEFIDSCHIVNLVSELRSKWGLGVQPISNIIALCELKGIKVFQFPEQIKEIDALSFFDEDNGCPVIFLNTFKSAERVRFDCAHELGHIIMHIYSKKIEQNRSYKELEKEANLFASEFLMPEEAFRASCPRYLTLENMMNVKKKWRTSLKAVNYKAGKLGLISEWVYRNNAMKINTMGYHLNEPEETHRDESIMLPKIVELLASQPDFNKQKMLSEMRVSEDDFNSLTFDVLRKWEDTQKPKFYFVD